MTEATALNEFLAHDVEGYLFHDLRVMQSQTVPPEAPGGGLSYPLLMTTLAGIELLGALLSPTSFDPRLGAKYFREYWTKFLYPSDPSDAVDVVYKLARHGIAHCFLLKGPLDVVKKQPIHHLKHLDGRFIIDAYQLAEDLIHSYESRVKANPTSSNDEVDHAEMTERLKEMSAEFQIQASSILNRAVSQIPSVADPPSTSAELSGPSGKASGLENPEQMPGGRSGPTGPVSSSISSSSLP